MLGTVADHVSKLEELKAVAITQVADHLQHDSTEKTMRVHDESVMPQLRDRLTATA